MALTPLTLTLTLAVALACGASERRPERAAHAAVEPQDDERAVAPPSPETEPRDTIVSSDTSELPPAEIAEPPPDPGEPAPASCVDGSYVHREPFFCIRPPPSYRAGREGQGTTSFLELAASNASDPRIQIRWFPGDERFYEQQRAATAQGAERDPNAVTRATHDSRGLYVRYDLDTRLAGFGGDQGMQRVSHGMSVARARGIVFWCVASVPAGARSSPEFLSAYETLTVTE